jgi:hypothetical protein
MIHVNAGGANDNPIVCDELITAVARPLVSALNHSRTDRIPDG